MALESKRVIDPVTNGGFEDRQHSEAAMGSSGWRNQTEVFCPRHRGHFALCRDERSLLRSHIVPELLWHTTYNKEHWCVSVNRDAQVKLFHLSIFWRAVSRLPDSKHLLP